MTLAFPRLALCGALLAAAVAVSPVSPAKADPADYAFEAVQAHVAADGQAKVAVRLIHLKDNKRVPDAVIFQTRMEMPMAGMAPMATRITAQKPTGDGDYPFVADLSMAGTWTLLLSAKVQGEPGTVTGKVSFMAMP
jgi:hypothetical protein